ncbi:MAG: hypothetical protein ACLQDF_15760 [Desulfomonilia bacterium]|jgi:hypothetical protein
MNIRILNECMGILKVFKEDVCRTGGDVVIAIENMVCYSSKDGKRL